MVVWVRLGVHMVSDILTQLTMLLSAALFVRLFTYRRGGARFRRGVSVVATILMGCAGAMVLFIAQGKLSVQAYEWPLVVVLAVFTVATVRCGGNLSSVLRDPSAWSGQERRKAGP